MELPRTDLFVPDERPDRFARDLRSGADAAVSDPEDTARQAADAAGTVQGAVQFHSRLVDKPFIERASLHARE